MAKMTFKEYRARREEDPVRYGSQIRSGESNLEEYVRLSRENAARERAARSIPRGIITGNANGVYASLKAPANKITAPSLIGGANGILRAGTAPTRNARTSSAMGLLNGVYNAGTSPQRKREDYLNNLIHGTKQDGNKMQIPSASDVLEQQRNASGIDRNADEPVVQNGRLVKPINELGAESQMTNPDKRFREGLQKKQEQEAEFAQHYQNRTNYIRPVPDEDMGGWLNPDDEAFYSHFKKSAVQQNVQNRERAIEMGVYNDTDNYELMNDYGLLKAYNDLAQKEYDLNWKIEHKQKEIDAGKWEPDALRIAKLTANEAQLYEIEQLEAAAAMGDQQAAEKLENNYLRYARMIAEQSVGQWIGEDPDTIAKEIYGRYDNSGNSYQEKLQSMNADERYEFRKEMWEALVGPIMEQDSVYANMLEKKYIQEKKDEINQVRENRSRYNRIMGREDGVHKFGDDYRDEDLGWNMPDGTYEYTAEYDKGNTAGITSDIHSIVSFVNGGKSYEDYVQRWQYTYGEGSEEEIGKQYRGAMYMLPEEVDMLTQLYMADVANGREPTQAQAFMDALQPYLNARSRSYEQAQNEYRANVFPVLSSGADVVLSLATPAQLLATGIGKATGAEGINDPYSPWFSIQRYQKDTENKIASNLGEEAAFWYRAGMSGAKNFIRDIATMGFGKFQAAADMAIFFSDCFLSSYQQRLEETHGDTNAAAIYAIVEAGNETMWEILPTEARLGTSAKTWMYVMNNFWSESFEEVLGSRFGPDFHRLFEGTDSWEQRAGQILYENGYTDKDGNWIRVPDDDLRAALDQMNREWTEETVNAFLSAFVSTGGAMGTRFVTNKVNNIRNTANLGREALRSEAALNSTFDRENAPKTRLEIGAANAAQMTTAALEMEEGTESRKLAEDLQRDMRSGKKLSNYKIGKLAQAMMKESGERVTGVIRSVMKDYIHRGLEEKGAKNADELTEIVYRKWNEEQLTEEEEKKFKDSVPAQEQLLTFMDPGKMMEVSKEIREKAKTPLSVRDTVTNLIGGNDMQTEENVRAMTDGAQTANRADILMKNVKHNGKEVQTEDGSVAEITKIYYKEETEGEGKNAKTVQRLVVDLSNDQKGVDASTLKAVDGTTAGLLQYGTLDGKRMASERFMNVVLNHANDTQNTAGMISDALKVRTAAWLGKSAPRTRLSAEMVKEVQDATAKDFADAEKERVANQREIRPGEGRVTFDGTTAYGTDDFNAKLNQIKDRNIRGEALAIARVAKSAGFDVDFYYNEKGAANQGSFSTSAGIRVNLAGTDVVSEKGGKQRYVHHNAIVTFGHEATHWLEKNSPKAYAQLRNFVVQTLERDGINAEQRLRDIIDNYARHGEELDMAGAVAEMVARGCDQILTSEKVAEELHKSDPSLYGKIREAVADIVTRIRNAFDRMTDRVSTREGETLKQYMSQLEKIWLQAYEEAKGAKPEITAEESQVLYSKQESSYKFDSDFIESINWYKNYPGLFNMAFGSDQIVIGETPKVLQDIGIADKPFTITQGHMQEMLLDTADKNHKMTPDELVEVIRKACNPVLIIYSRNAQRTNDSIVEIIDYKKNGHIVVVPVRISTEARANNLFIDVNKMSSVYGRENAKSLIEDAIRTELTGNVPGIYYYNKKKADFLRKEGVRFPYVAKNNGLIHNIKDNKNFVNQNENHPYETKLVRDKIQKSIQDDLDARYAAAVEQKDWATAEEMLLEKMQQTAGIVGYRAVKFSNGEGGRIAKAIKTKDMDVIRQAAREMAEKVPENAVLVPIPPHEGIVLEDTDTLLLANEISRITGAPVIVALESNTHTSRKVAKKTGDRSVTAGSMGFRQVKEIPEGAMPVFIDNMVGGGTTAMAAHDAIGRGITLAYAQSARTKSAGVKTLSVTYDQNGNLIPLSQRIEGLLEQIANLPTEYFEAKPQRAVGFDEIEKVILPAEGNEELKAALDQRGIAWEEYDGTDEDRLRALNEQEDAKFSIRDEMDFDVKHWMMSVNENSLQTEAEKVLLRQFKDLNMKEQLYRKREEDYRKRIQALESRGEENLDKDAKYELQGLRVRLANATKVKEQTQAEMGRITSSEGYGRMMRDQNRIFNDFMYGKTQAEVTDAVERLEKSSREIEKIIRENQAAVSEMEKSEVIQRLKKALGKTTIDQAAADLKKAFNSTWTRNEIKVYLEPILVKMANGENFESDVEELASILVASDKDNIYEGLEDLRGLQIVVGKSQLKELRAAHSSIKELRRRLAGSGITIKAGDYATLDNGFDNLLETYPTLRGRGLEEEAENASNIVEAFVSWVERAMEQSGSKEFYAQRMAEAIATVMEKAMGTASGIYIPAETQARKQVLELIEYVKSLQARTEAAERTLEKLAQRAGQLHTEGLKAAGMANTLTTNVGEALQYFNTTAKLAVAQAKQNRQNQIIDQLKSDFAKKMAKSNEEWRNLIERDRNARAQAEQNRKYRNQIRTVLKRAYNKLRSPKGMDNVPEYMQGLARELIGTFVDNDLAGGMRFTDSPREALQEIRRVLDAWDTESGKFNLADLNDAEEVVATIINQDLMTIYDGIAAINGEIRGRNKLDTLQQRGAILQQIQEATSEIWSAIRAENTVQVQKRRIAVEDQAYKIAMAMGNRQAKEWTGKARNAIHAMRKAIVSGNMTPEYFFRALKNAGLTDLWENYHEAENRNGLELAKAKAKLAEIAKKYGFETWDTDQKVTLTLASGHQVKMTIGQLMSLYATWRREMTLGPDISQHLAGGGFFAEQDTRDGILGREVMEKRAHRISVTKDSDGNITGSPDMAMVESMLTQEQADFVNEVVAFMSNDMSELGNEASMAAYGIKLYKEGYYFPFQMWDGVRSRKSNDSGSAAAAQDRAFHPSFSKSRKHGANNALVIGDFMRTVTDHVAGMINYATMGLANESLQKTLNTQLKEDYGPDEINKRNIWAMMEEAYGRDAVQYLRELQQQLNGGAVRTTKSIGDKAITLFRKNAVAGSLSVAFQQPLSYIRAAMMISPKYLTQALNPTYWRGSYREMLAHSGVAVIKDMGRFDMNFGQSARDYLTPDGMESHGRKAWNFITDKATILPELFDRMTWTRMWSAVKIEQHALHPEMDIASDEFLDLCGVRFNDIMRRTQVYDSTLVKSANMRSDNYFVKSLTSFMAEPTVTMNVLADAVRSAVQHEEGSGRLVRYAAGTFVVSAVMQALIKALFSSGRSPDEKKTWAENFLYRFGGNLISEMDPLQLIPGYSDLITLLKDGKLNDDAMGAIGKIYTSTKGVADLLLGNKEFSHRNLEDSIGQLVQLFTGLPAKNIMRDGRAMYNLLSEWTVGNPAYAQRANSGAVIRGQFTESLVNADNLIGLIIKELGEAGYETNNAAYYERIYQAKKEGRDEDAQNMIDYLLLGKGVKQSAIDNGVKKAAKSDGSISYSDRIKELRDLGMKDADIVKWIAEEYQDGRIDKEEAVKLYMEANPKKSQDDAFFYFEQIDWEKETGEDVSTSDYFRLNAAMESGDKQEFNDAAAELKEHGYDQDKIDNHVKDVIMNRFKEGEADKEQTKKDLKKYVPSMTDDDIFWSVDRVEFQQETGADKVSGQYYRLKYAIEQNDSKAIKDAVKMMTAHGYTNKQIKSWIGNKSTGFKTAYLEAKGAEKVQIKNALIMAYKAVGLTETEANDIINKWKPEGDTSGSVSSGRTVGSLTGGKPSKQTKDEMFWENMYKNTTGKLNGKGNIDLNKRKVVHNPDGSISTERSFSVNIDGKEVLLPTVINGRIVSEDEAIDHYFETGEHLGKFDTVEEADEYAEKLHERQEWYYNGR